MVCRAFRKKGWVMFELGQPLRTKENDTYIHVQGTTSEWHRQIAVPEVEFFTKSSWVGDPNFDPRVKTYHTPLGITTPQWRRHCASFEVNYKTNGWHASKRAQTELLDPAMFGWLFELELGSRVLQATSTSYPA